MAELQYAAASDLGFADPELYVNEDFVFIKEFNTDEGVVVLGIVADGAGSNGQTKFQPAALATIQIVESIERLCQTNVADFLSCPQVFLQEAMVSASYTLGAFRMADPQRYSGFATSLSCICIYNNNFAFAHTGITRIHLIRSSKKEAGKYDVLQLTRDQTKGMDEVDNGRLSFNEYHLHPSRLEVTGGLGTTVTPRIQTFAGQLKLNDFVLITSDGIHDALRPDVMFELLKRSRDCDEAVKTLIVAAKTEQYQDNMAAALFWYGASGNEASK